MVNLVAGFCSAVVGVVIALLVMQSPDVPIEKTPDHWYDRAQVSAQTQRWKEAAEELEIARVLGLEQTRYSVLALNIQQAIVDQRILEQLTQGVESGLSWPQVMKLGSQIDKASVYWTKSQILLETIKRKFVDRWSRAAYRAYMVGNLKTLRRLLDNISAADAEHRTVRELARHLVK